MSIAPSIGDVLGAAGDPPVITHNGKSWKMAYPTAAIRDRLEKLIVADAWTSVKAAECGIPELDDEAKKSFHEAIRNRAYRTGGKMWSEAFGRVDGQLLLYLALLQEYHPEATKEDVVGIMAECPDEFTTAMLLVTPRFFYIAAEAQGLPPAQRKKFALQQTEELRKVVAKARAANETDQPQTTPSS